MGWIVVEVKALSDFRLQVAFIDGVEGKVHMKDRVHARNAGVFAALRDPKVFSQVFIEHGAVTWPGELDLAPDAMHEQIKTNGEWVLK